MVFVEPAWSFVDNGAGGPGLGNPTPFQPGGPAYTSEISFGKRPPAPLKVWNPWTQLTSVSLWRGLWGPRLLSVFPTKPPGLPAPRWVPATLHSTETPWPCVCWAWLSPQGGLPGGGSGWAEAFLAALTHSAKPKPPVPLEDP